MSFQVIAHRGAMGYERQNTLSSFRKALEIGADGLEFDVFLSKDSKVVVFHDEILEELTDTAGHPSSLTLKELSELEIKPDSNCNRNLPHSEIRIPSLIEVLDLVDRYNGKKKPWVNIELKGDGTEYEIPNIIMQYDKKRTLTSDRFLISSFDHNQLRRVKSSNPKLKLGVLYSGIFERLNEEFASLKPYSVHPDIDTINQEVVTDAHNRGFKVYIWTVNKEWQAQKVVPLGIDGAFTNYPDRMKKWAAKYS